MVSEMWKRVRQATNHLALRCTHHDPQSEAHRLVQEFSTRTSSNSLPPDLRANQQCLKSDKLALLRDKALQPDESDGRSPWGTKKIINPVLTQHGNDRISYPISHLSFAGELAFLQLNKSWQISMLPQSWK